MKPFSDQIEVEKSRSVVYFDVRASWIAKTGENGVKNSKNGDFWRFLPVNSKTNFFSQINHSITLTKVNNPPIKN